MGSSISAEEVKSQEEKKKIAYDLAQARERKFAVKQQDTKALTALFEAFANGDPAEAKLIVQSINNNLLTFAPGDKFKGALQNTGTHFVPKLGYVLSKWIPQETFDQYAMDCEYKDYYGDKRLGKFYIDGVKPIVLAYLFTAYNLVYELKWGHGWASKLVSEGLQWLAVVKEMMKNVNFKPDSQDRVFGMTLFSLVTHSNINSQLQRYTSETEKYRPLVYDKEVVRYFLNGVSVTNEKIFTQLINDDNYQVFRDLLDVCDCKEVLAKKNLLYDIERTRLDYRYILFLINDHKQSATVKHGELYCYEYALKQKNFKNFLRYKEIASPYDTLKILATSITKQDYISHKQDIDAITKGLIAGVHKSTGGLSNENMKPILTEFTDKGIFELANNAVNWIASHCIPSI